jgi:hypothetical protein
MIQHASYVTQQQVKQAVWEREEENAGKPCPQGPLQLVSLPSVSVRGFSYVCVVVFFQLGSLVLDCYYKYCIAYLALVVHTTVVCEKKKTYWPR